MTMSLSQKKPAVPSSALYLLHEPDRVRVVTGARDARLIRRIMLTAPSTLEPIISVDLLDAPEDGAAEALHLTAETNDDDEAGAA
jgi:hypothetical protein